MSVIINFRKIKSTDAIKEHVEKRMEKFSKFVTYPLEIHVLLSLEKALHCCEITLHAEHKDLVALAKTNDLYESVDEAAHKIETQLKKEREKRKGHNTAHLASRPASLRLAQDIEADVPHREKKITEK